MAQTLPEPPFPGGLPQPQVYPTYGKNKYKANSSIKQGPLVVASWNVRNLQNTGRGARGRTTLIACERARYNIDIATLSEARLPEEGSLVEMERINGERRHIFSGVVNPTWRWTCETTKSNCWEISMPVSTEIMTHDKVSLVIKVSTT